MYYILGSFKFSKFLIIFTFQYIRLFFITTNRKNQEILAISSQLSLYENQVKNGKRPKPKATPEFRQTWIFLSKFYPNWNEGLTTFSFRTVTKWHRKKFKEVWAKKSKRIGRPPIPRVVINLIRKIYMGNYEISSQKIHEQLVLLGLIDPPCRNTIEKYIPNHKKPPTKRQVENYITFIKNHMSVTWAADFFTVPTVDFQVLYVLVVIEHSSSKIVHYSVTKSPNAFWLAQQFRNATPFGVKPKYLIHDNDPAFKSIIFQRFLEGSNIKSKATSYRSHWQNPYAERVIGTIRKELLNNVVPISKNHLKYLLNDYIHNYYNTSRTHQGINGQTPIRTPEYDLVDAKDLKIETTPVLNGLYHTYKRVA